MNIKEYLKDNILLFDGGMGTYYSQRTLQEGSECEKANLTNPDLIVDIHKEYIASGCNAIKTNTFATNRIMLKGDGELVEEVIAAGVENAKKAVEGTETLVFADIGPAYGVGENTTVEKELTFVADCFIKAGIKNYLFETCSDTEGLIETAMYIRRNVEDSYIIMSFAVQPGGFTRDGRFAEDIFEEVISSGAADAVGLNCICGAGQMLELVEKLNIDGITFSVMPNSSYPTVMNNRSHYEGDPVYFATKLAEIAKHGVSILGGCCGTTPMHITQLTKALDGIEKYSVEKKAFETQSKPEVQDSAFWEKLKMGQKVVAVELDPPPDVNLEKFMSGAWTLKGKKADIITIADCPIARARMDSSILACKLRRELNIDALPHMTCRDRNLNATKALMMGLYAEGIRNVLLVTGDPIPTAERDEVKSVYQFNSRKLAAFANGLNKSMFPTPLHVFGALNINARNFDIQLSMAKQKEEKGMIGFLTQPVLTEKAFENLKKARQELNGYILGGIIPVVSAKNAKFMDSEISGINVDPKIIEMYEGKDRAESENLAVEISSEIAKRISEYVDGYYLITPFQRTELIGRIIDEIDKAGIR